MDMTAEAARWYDSPRLGGSPNTGIAGGVGGPSSVGGNGPLGNSHAAAAVAAANGGGLEASDMFYALENGSRRYYSGHYSPHGKCLPEPQYWGVSFFVFFSTRGRISLNDIIGLL